MPAQFGGGAPFATAPSAQTQTVLPVFLCPADTGPEKPSTG